MRHLSLSSALLVAVIASPSWAAAQSTVTTETRVNLRRTASTALAPLRVLKALERLEVTGAEQNEFLPVRTPRGDEGWVARDYVFTDAAAPPDAAVEHPLHVIGLDAPSDSISTDWERPPVSKSTMKHDPDDGTRCGPRGGDGGDWETFVLKNRSDYPAASHAVTFASLEVLPYKDGGLAKDRVGEGSHWTAEQKQEVERYEGIPLTITGFLAAVKPQAGSTEGTNCRFKGEANTDWHIALVPGYRDGEDRAIVVEPTPRLKRKHPNWRKAMLADRTGAQRSPTDSVRVTGFLFYDPDHANHLGHYRATMWELHPVTRIELFRDGVWVDLDDM